MKWQNIINAYVVAKEYRQIEWTCMPQIPTNGMFMRIIQKYGNVRNAGNPALMRFEGNMEVVK